MKRIGKTAIFLLFAVLALRGTSVLAAMSSTNYQINWDAVSSGGDDTSSSASYQLRDTVGSQGAGDSSSTSYGLDVGYRGGVYDRVADFEVFLEYRNSEVAASALVGSTVTVNSTSGMSVGDMILIVQDRGDSQNSAIGRIIDITGDDVTLDTLTDSGTSPTINDDNDYVYRMSSSTLSFGSLTSGNIATGVIAWETTADVTEGYKVFVYEDHDLRIASDTSKTINDVSDGDVSGGEEYGGRSSDATLTSSTFDTADTAITSEFQEVASNSGNSFELRDFLTMKAVTNGLTNDGTYSHTISIIYAGDY